jgi:hypothetical protein
LKKSGVKIICSECGALIAQKDCRCKGKGKFQSGWKIDHGENDKGSDLRSYKARRANARKEA